MTDASARIDELEAALRRVVEWADAYPTWMFTEVDGDTARRARAALAAEGIAIERLAADAMRHCLAGVRRIASTALGEK